MPDATDGSLEERFTVEELVGRGAFGEVYRGTDRATGERVAIKRLVASADAAAGERMRLEGRVLSRVATPYVVRCLGQGADAAGNAFLALEWLDGSDLNKLKRAGELGAAQAVEIARQTALGLQALHDAGVVHRDVKPSNVFVLAGDGPPRAKIIDLGIARAAFEPTLTVEGFRVGTPSYMSPEQVRGDAAVTPRSDLFSLGVMLYELLAGFRPFRGGDPYAVLAKIMLEEPGSLAEANPRVTPALEALVARAMAKDPARRFESARAMVDALDALGPLPVGPALLVRNEDGTSDATVRAPGSSTVSRSERRLVTVLFAAFDAVAAPDAAREFENAACAHGGVAYRTAAAGAVAAFGLSRSAGDEAVRAARAALRSSARLPGARLAVSTCRVTADATGLSGDAIERGAALLGGAASGVRVDEASARLLESHFRVEPGEAGAKYLLGERSAADDPGPRLRGVRTPTVGRERELAVLQAAYEECADDSVARAVVVTAPAGFGKSRVRYELLGRVRARGDGARVWLARGDPMGAGSPFGMVAQLVRAGLGLGAADGPDALAARVARTVVPESATRVAEFLGELVGVTFPDDTSVQLRAARQSAMLMGDQMCRAWEDFLGAECLAGPVVLVLEDLHWGDVPSVKFVDAALRNLADRPLLVLALARPEVAAIFPNLWAERGVHSVHLSELSRKAAERVARAALGPSTPEDTISRVVERAGGNAFYLEELVRAVADGRDGALPDTVLATVQARLDALDDEARRTARAASVFGRTFWSAGVAAVLGMETGNEWGRSGALAPLVEREIVARRAEARFAGGEEYLFRHALVQEAAYAAMPEPERLAAHGRAGTWLEAVGETDAMALAAHFETGGAHTRAADWYRRAAEQALEGNDLDAAIARAARGVEAASRGGGGALGALGGLLVLRAEAHRWRGEYADVARYAREAMALLVEGSAAWYRAAAHLASACADLGRVEDLEALVARLEALGLAGDRSASFVTAAAGAVLHLLVVGRYERADALLGTIAAARPDTAEHGPAAWAWVCRARASRLLRAGDVAAYGSLSAAAAEGFDHAGDLRNACVVGVSMGYASGLLGNYAEAERALRTAIARSERMGIHRLTAAARQNRAMAVALQGSLDEALDEQRASVAAFEAQGGKRMEGGSRLYLARILEMRGELDSADREARASIALLAVSPPMRAYALGVLARVMLARGDAGAAVEQSEQGVALLESLGGIEEGESLVRLAHAEALWAAGDLTGARRAITTARDRILTRAAKIGDPTSRTSFVSNVSENARTLALATRWLTESD